MSPAAKQTPLASASRAHRPTAVVYCEANFGLPDGKTANGLVRSSERYDIGSRSWATSTTPPSSTGRPQT